MKKICEMLVVAGILFTIIPVTAMAEAVDEEKDDLYYESENELVVNAEECLSSVKPDDLTQSKYSQNQRLEMIKNRYHKLRCSVEPKISVKLKGLWGFADDNVSDGYFSGKIIFGQTGRIFKGAYNKSDNDTKGRIVGILKNNYFNGKIVTKNGACYPIVGLFRVNKEDKIFKMKWLTPHNSGWAVARLLIET